MDDGLVFTVIGQNNAPMGRFTTFEDARKAAEAMLSDGRATQARVEWKVGDEVRQRPVRNGVEEIEEITKELLGSRPHSPFDHGMFRPAMLGAVIVAAVGIMSWALYNVLDIVIR